ncbi:MAG: helicase RepA family protein [Firmicutes bacterium]|nr:helicase RepA family protein [Bacillota bacterium]
MLNEKEMTAANASVGAEARQSSQHNDIITEITEKSKSFDEDLKAYQKEMRRQFDPAYLKTVTMPDLYNSVFERQQCLIEGLLPRGTYLFVGSPKVGKSFMMAQIAYHISTGTPLWNYKVCKAPVLYFALEDDYARLQQRMYQMFGTNEAEDLYFATHSKKLGDGFEEQITGFIKEHPSTGLIIVDTLKRVRESTGEYSYSSDYDSVAKLKTIADSRKVSMLIVHHTRKMPSKDKFDMISGANGLLGAADGAFVLSKKNRTDNEATLDITGRDQQDMRLKLTRDTDKLIWILDTVETELWKKLPEPLLEKVAQLLTADKNEWTGTATELCEAINADVKPNTLTRKLNVNAGRLYDEYGIKYENTRSHEGRKISLTHDSA